MTITVRFSSSHGYILSIADLRRVFSFISHGSRRWWIENNVTLHRDPGKQTFWLTLHHANPVPGQMTDEISFQVPVLQASIVSSWEETALVCLDPEIIRPHVEGLYLENDRVVGDCLEDWNLFWPPIKQALSNLLRQ
jgi:hypothetical protein